MYWAFGSPWVQPQDKRSPCFIVAKFSPLIQIRSTDPSVSLPADFSPSTLFTASTVSAIGTWLIVTPTFWASSLRYPVTSLLMVSSPPHMYQLTVLPLAAARMASHAAVSADGCAEDARLAAAEAAGGSVAGGSLAGVPPAGLAPAGVPLAGVPLEHAAATTVRTINRAAYGALA